MIVYDLTYNDEHRARDAFNSLNTKSRQGRTVLTDSSLNDDFNDKTNNLSIAESKQEVDDLQFGSKPYYSTKFNLNDLDNLQPISSNNLQPKSFERRNSINAPDFQANAAGFIVPDYLADSANTASSSNNILNKLAPYESVEEYRGYLNDKNSFVPSTILRERRKGYIESGSSTKYNPYNQFYDRQIDEQNQFDPLYASPKHQLSKHRQHPRDNEFASNSILESVSSPLDNQDFGFGNNFISNDFVTSSNYNTELSALNSLAGIRNLGALSALNPTLGLTNAYNNLSPLTSSSSLVGTLGGTLNGLNSVVPPGAIVGAPGSSPPPGMKLAGYVTVTNSQPNIGSMSSPNNLLAASPASQQMLFNQVMNRNPQTQALAQVMAQSMAQGIRIPFANPYANNLQLLPALSSSSNSNFGSSSNSNSGNGNSNSNNSNSNNSNNLSNGEQQVAASSSKAKFLQRLNPLNLFRRLRTRNQKNNSNKNKDQSNNSNSNDASNNQPDLEDRSQFFIPADLLLGAGSTTNQQQLPQLTVQQQQLAEQLNAQLTQLNMQLAQQSNNKAKFLRKMGNNVKKVAKRDLSNQLNQSASDEPVKKQKHTETILNVLEDQPNTLLAKQNETNLLNGNDTETAENGFFPVADLYQNYKFNLRPRFPSVREQRRISNVHGLHVNTNNYLTSGSMKSNFVNLMGSRNFEVIQGGILNNDRNTDHSMLHGMHSNNGHSNHPNHKLPHHHQNQRNTGHSMLSNKGNKFNIDNDFDDDEEEDDDSLNNSGFNNGGSIMGNQGNSNSNQRNGNNVMFLDDDLFGSGMHKNNGGMLGFQGFNSFNGGNQHFNSFNALSSASNFNNQQLNNSKIENNAAQSKDHPDIKSIDNKLADKSLNDKSKNANQTTDQDNQMKNN